MAKDIIRIGGASAFWGDTTSATPQLLENGRIDYLVYDYLAEVTLSIMAGQKLEDPQKGYAVDFVRDTIIPHHKAIAAQQVKVISNAGGVNPIACGKALQTALEKEGSKLQVAVVTGDDLMPLQQQIRGGQLSLNSGTPLPPFFLTLNAYTGYQGILNALQQGADIIVTGRVADSALTLAIAMYEFAWAATDFDKMAQASLAGHLIECGPQATGGNFTDWDDINFENIGFPIAECHKDGTIFIDKPKNSGGLVSTATVAEQLVYEIHDPENYALPDLVCDWSQVTLQDIQGKVKVTHARGKPPTNTLKIAGTYPDGYKISAAFLIYGAKSGKKAALVANQLKTKIEMGLEQMGLGDFTNFSFDVIGQGSTCLRPPETEANEVVLKLNATHTNKKALVYFSKELAQASTSLAPGLCPITNGRPKVHPMIRLWTSLIDRNQVQQQVHFNGDTMTVEMIESAGQHKPMGYNSKSTSPYAQAIALEPDAIVPLSTLCFARSGDKGDTANIGVIARNDTAWQLILKILTADFVQEKFKKYLDHPESRVERYELPGIQALNFVLHHALGGGGFASLRLDTQAKGFAQLLLQETITLPSESNHDHDRNTLVQIDI